jgi:L-iditol 2-dehydrogenase
MKLARYHGRGVLRIEDEPAPKCPPGGLLVRTEACGLCSGELMDWYMDRKAPHVLGHEVAGTVVESQDARFPRGARVFAHHHAPCLDCPECERGRHVHCPQWRTTRLDPGGMAEAFAVSAANLSDTLRADDLRAVDAALIEPLACVAKSLRKARVTAGDRCAVIGLGAMGLMHLLLLGPGAQGIELLESRRSWALQLGLDARPPEGAVPADVVFVCPADERALGQALAMAAPGARVVLFAPMPPPGPTPVPLPDIYFRDLELLNCYSCGPDDTREAAGWLRQGRAHAEQVVSHFVRIEELPQAYRAMKLAEILKAMVVFA